MANRRKRLYHIFVNDLINDKRTRLSAADPNYWLMLKIANSTYFLSSQSHQASTLLLSHTSEMMLSFQRGKEGKRMLYAVS